MKSGRYNVGIGLLSMSAFMIYGFILIYLRDFAPDKEAWIQSYGIGKHFEARLAHVHGNLFALLNVTLGFVLARLEGLDVHRQRAAALGLLGMMMPTGILMEVYLGTLPIFVLGAPDRPRVDLVDRRASQGDEGRLVSADRPAGRE